MAVYLAAAPAFFLGAFPSAYVFGKLFKGLDIRRVGSGNVGGMNTIREAGFLPGLLTIFADIGKGTLSVYLAGILSGETTALLLAAFLAILGHNFNPFLRFHGGKGLAVTLGAFLLLSPLTILFLLGLMLLFSLVLRDTNTGAGAATALLPAVLWFQYNQWSWAAAGAAMALLIVTKHMRDFQAYAAGRRKLV